MENSQIYKERIKRHTPKSPVLKNCLGAFLSGGAICLFGELLAAVFMSFTDRDTAYLLVTLSIILISALASALGVYDNAVRFAGAGLLVPVSGFANSVISPALDTKNEGLLVGVGSGIFKVAGPVILFSVLSGVAYGAIYYLLGVLF